MNRTNIPAAAASILAGTWLSSALRRWAERDDANAGWCTTLSRDHTRDQRPPVEKPRDQHPPE